MDSDPSVSAVLAVSRLLTPGFNLFKQQMLGSGFKLVQNQLSNVGV